MAEGSSGPEGQGVSNTREVLGHLNKKDKPAEFPSQTEFSERARRAAEERRKLTGESDTQSPQNASKMKEFGVSDVREMQGLIKKTGGENKDQGLTDPQEFADRLKKAGEVRTTLEGPPQNPTTPPAPKGPVK